MPVIGTCNLCLAMNVELIDSHVMPKFLYRKLRLREEDLPAGVKDRNPVFVAKGKARTTSEQMHEHMLCRTCEDRFGRNENYISGLVYQPSGSAPVFDKLGPRTVVNCGDVGAVADLGTLAADELAYFGMSMLWRAHAATD